MHTVDDGSKFARLNVECRILNVSMLQNREILLAKSSYGQLQIRYTHTYVIPHTNSSVRVDISKPCHTLDDTVTSCEKNLAFEVMSPLVRNTNEASTTVFRHFCCVLGLTLTPVCYHSKSHSAATYCYVFTTCLSSLRVSLPPTPISLPST